MSAGADDAQEQTAREAMGLDLGPPEDGASISLERLERRINQLMASGDYPRVAELIQQAFLFTDDDPEARLALAMLTSGLIERDDVPRSEKAALAGILRSQAGDARSYQEEFGNLLRHGRYEQAATLAVLNIYLHQPHNALLFVDPALLRLFNPNDEPEPVVSAEGGGDLFSPEKDDGGTTVPEMIAAIRALIVDSYRSKVLNAEAAHPGRDIQNFIEPLGPLPQ